jgi:predicted double-glycine peptidase
MRKLPAGVVTGLILLLMQGGCASSRLDRCLQTQVLPLAPQSSERYQCGPSTLASVLAFHGDPVSETVIAGAIYSPSAQGVLLSDMAGFARQQGFRAEVLSGSMDDLKQAVGKQLPPIVLLDYGMGRLRKPHFTAITAVGDRGIFQLTDKRADAYVRMRLFERLWKRAGHQYLVITPAVVQ